MRVTIFTGRNTHMRKTILLAAAGAVLASLPAFADDWVRGYNRRDGTFVQPHFRSERDGNPFNNYSTQGNTNPYTGQMGTVNPYAAPRPSFGAPNHGRTYNPYGLR